MITYLRSIKARDPAARSYLQIILLYPGVKAMFWFRIAHFLFFIKLKLLAEFIMLLVKMIHGIEIHPAARIGHCNLVIFNSLSHIGHLDITSFFIGTSLKLITIRF